MIMNLKGGLSELKKYWEVVRMDIYLEDERLELFDCDEIDDLEFGFMEGYCTNID